MAKRNTNALESAFIHCLQGQTPLPYTGAVGEDIAYQLSFIFFQILLPEHQELYESYARKVMLFKLICC